ncbi:hypothetical protein CYMTET_30328 [Cymbomonas tetramitiformis]|uniref:SKP1 component dimerisation domain-containing protein n=1 Tax=Cymbomonas tetramitiformis TaxID=36881 RepID=A0AAE0FJA5_9CHLO|nr:hypothetical protein CYMTET_30328 [Cymbomonas tetramitiformis]
MLFFQEFSPLQEKDKLFNLLDNTLFSDRSSQLRDSDILSEPANCVFFNQFLIYAMCTTKPTVPAEEIKSYFVRQVKKLASTAPGSLLASLPEEYPEGSAMQEVKDIVLWLKLCRQKFDRVLYIFRDVGRRLPDRRALEEVCEFSMIDCLQQANISVRLNQLKDALLHSLVPEQWNECEQMILPLLPLFGSHSDVLRNLLDFSDREDELRLPNNSQVTEAPLGSELRSDRKQLFLKQVASKSLTIITQDAELRELDWSTVEKCGTLKWGLLSVLNGFGREEPVVDCSTDGWIKKTVLPVMVEASIFDKVKEFDTLISVSEPSEGTTASAWLENLCLSDIFDLTLAANALDFNELCGATCRHIANMIKGKTAEEIRQTFNIHNDFTPEEEEEVRRENQWAFE